MKKRLGHVTALTVFLGPDVKLELTVRGDFFDVNHAFFTSLLFGFTKFRRLRELSFTLPIGALAHFHTPLCVKPIELRLSLRLQRFKFPVGIDTFTLTILPCLSLLTLLGSQDVASIAVKLLSQPHKRRVFLPAQDNAAGLLDVHWKRSIDSFASTVDSTKNPSE
jgi:hypothetical protein